MNNTNLRSHSGRGLLSIFTFYLLPFALVASGCASFEAGSNLQRGRYALLRGDSKLALSHFQRTSEIDPNYYYRIGPMKEGVWTYVGRAHYAAGDTKSAQKSLEQARKVHPDDSFAPVYLGLALSKEGDRQRAAKELQTGLTGLNDWFEYINRNSADKAYWDPGSDIRSGIREQLARIDSKEINWPALIADTERIGIEIENEADEVAKDKRRERRDAAKGDDKSN
jgi:tetratricopeptide (TPR) repeat protein